MAEYMMSDYPDKDLLEKLWKSGMRAKEIGKYLEENNLPSVSHTALAKYGQRWWNKEAKKGKQAVENFKKVTEVEELVESIKQSDIGEVSRISFSKSGYAISISPKPEIDKIDDIAELPRIDSKPPRKRSKRSKEEKGPATHIIIPDTQIEPGRDWTHIEWAARYITEQYSLTPNLKIIHLGDHWNMGSLSSYDKGKGTMEGRRYLADIESGNEAFKPLIPLTEFAECHFLLGNHECLDEETQAITIDGPKYWWELKKDDLVLSCNDDLTEKWVPVKEIHVYDYEGEMHTHTGRTGMKVTPNHRIVGLQQSAWEKKNVIHWKEHLAYEYSNLCIPTTTLNHKPDCEKFSDLDIRLIAWAFSDSYRNPNGQWVFYQSQPKEDRIINLLDEAGLTYKTYKRERDIKEICGKKLKKSSAPNYEFHLNEESSQYIDALINSKDYLPDYVWSWSERQVRLFMDELIYTDGSITKEDSKMIYHSRATRTDLMNLFMTNGISCTLSEYAKDYWRLNITHKSATRVESSQLKTEKYKGKVWCITVENGRFFALANRTTKNGFRLCKPFLTGNSRADKAANSDIQLEGLITTDHMLTPGWERHTFLEVIEIDEISYSHYFYNPNTSKPYGDNVESRLKTLGRSFVQGHQQGLKFANRYINGVQQIGIVAGSFYTHEENYMGPQGTGYWRGIVVLNNVENGEADPEFISLDQLCRMYEGKSLEEYTSTR